MSASDPAPAPPQAPWGLTRYVTAATLARSVDGGAVLAVVLIVTESGGPAWIAGLLGAAITAPHLLGPFMARGLDTAGDGRMVIALACVVHGLALAAAVLLYPHSSAAVPAALLIAAGLVGPFLTGGISSRLAAIAGPSQRRQRRAQGWDVATYGLGGTIGPVIVAVLSGWSSPTAAALVLAASALVAACLVLLLPFARPAAARAEVPRPWRTLSMMIASGRLRRTLYLTVAVALSVAVLPIAAVSATSGMESSASAAGALIAAYGFGSLLGSAGVMIRPLRGEADPSMTRLALVVASTLLAALLAPSLGVLAVCYAAAGIANACFFAATLAARSDYAPATARGQVFVWVGALKITAGSAGTAAAGAITPAAPHLPLVLAAILTVAAALASAADRSLGSAPV